MPTYRVKEQYLITQWTYFNALDKDTAYKMVCDGENLNEFKKEEIELDWHYIEYGSLEEVKNK